MIQLYVYMYVYTLCMCVCVHIYIYMYKVNLIFKKYAARYVRLFPWLGIGRTPSVVTVSYHQGNGPPGKSHIYIHLYSFPIWFIKWCLIKFSVLYRKTLLFIRFICNSLHLLTQTSYFFLLNPLFLGNHRSVLCFHESVSLS